MTVASFTLRRQAVRQPAVRRLAVRRSVHARRSRISARRHAPNLTWEVRSFGAVGGAIGVAFLLALLYLFGSTGVSTLGYEAQRLEGTLGELRRQNALLEVQLAKLDSPARIQAEATRLGLMRVSFVPVVSGDAVPLGRAQAGR